MLRHRPNSIVSLGDGTEAYMELNADSTTDLATTYQGYDIAAGSICLVIETGDFYVLDGGGNWVNQTSPEAVNASVQSSTRGMKKSALPTLPLDYKEEYEDDDDFDDGDDMR